jgi:hypothetical protein
VCGVSGHYDELRRRNKQRADEVLHALLEVHFAPVEQAVEEDAYESWGGQQGFQEAKEKAKRAVLAASGSSGSVLPVLVWERLEKLTSKAAQRLQQRLVHARQQSEAALLARIAQAEGEKRDVVRKLTSELEHASLRSELVQEQQQQAEVACSSLKAQLERQREEAGQQREKMRAQEEAHREELAKVREEAEGLRAAVLVRERECQQVQRDSQLERARERERERAGQVEGEKMRVLEAECQKLREMLQAVEGEGASEKLALKQDCARTCESLQAAQRRLESVQSDLAREKARADNEMEMRERERKEFEKWKLEHEEKRVSWEDAARRDREEARERDRAEVFERTTSEWQVDVAPVCVCMYILYHAALYVYVYAYMCAYTYTHTHINAHIHTYTHTHTFIHVYIHTYIHTYVYIQTHIHTFVLHTYQTREWQDRLRARELELAREAEEWRLRVSVAETTREEERLHESEGARARAAEERRLLLSIAEILGGLDQVVLAGVDADAEAAGGGQGQGRTGDAWPRVLERARALRRDFERQTFLKVMTQWLKSIVPLDCKSVTLLCTS